MASQPDGAASEGAADNAAPSDAFDSRWWVRDPARLQRELEALAAAGIAAERDSAAEGEGVLRLDLTHPPVEGLGPDPVRLIAIFPDHYPFFPVHVEAPDLDLAHHQNPFVKNLCLLARSVSTWRPATDTLAGILAEQLPRLVTVAATEDAETMAELEEHVPEPATWYYPYERTSAVLVAVERESIAARVPDSATYGSFVLGLEELPRPGVPGASAVLRGALLSVQNHAGRTLLEAPPALVERYAQRPHVTGYWARTERAVVGAPDEDPADAVYKAAEHADPRKQKPPALELPNNYRLRMRATLFAEEQRWRGEAHHVGDGWAFAVRMYSVPADSSHGGPRGGFIPARGARGARGRSYPTAARPASAKTAPHRSNGPTERVVYLARPQRYLPADLALRAPELAPLAAHSVAVFGLGCLGAPSAFELARASVGGLRLLDGDHVEAATTLRWPVGLSAFGWPKAAVVAGLVKNDYPYVRVEAEIVHQFGDVRRLAGRTDAPKGMPVVTEADIMTKMLAGASLLYDACAERGVQYFLSQAARARGLPYAGVQGTPGGWGGMVVCVDPARTEGCWGCLQHWLGVPTAQGGIPGPPQDPLRGDVGVEGCAERTYAGANPDLGEVALMGVRMTMGILANMAGAAGEPADRPRYPRAPWDVAVLSLRDAAGRLIAPRWDTFDLRRHPSCTLCSPAGRHGGA
ncbi:MAG TPA: ThiF family adenylyltransferase [Gemmatimonadales bacterium]|nr:ThiF family adenylyltransferase [Gemmatimonadales bacterium]